MVAQSFRLLSPRLGREIATTSYFKAAAKILACIASMRVVASNREFGPPTLRTVQYRLDLGCRADRAGMKAALAKKRRFESPPATSGRPPSTDVIRPVRLVQEAEIARTAKCNLAKRQSTFPALQTTTKNDPTGKSAKP